jgi:pimeloyl-ACP methyl ester carboxylesterase
MHALSGHEVVFLPGIDGTGISCEPLRPLLPRDVPVTVVRYPTDRLLSFEETLHCAMGQIPSAGKDPIVIAESFSGPVAIALIGSGRLRAKCLILAATFARTPRPIGLTILSTLPLEHMLRLPWPRCLLTHVIAGGEETTDLFLAMWQRVKNLVPARVMVHRLEVIRHTDVRRWLPGVRVPSLYIQAAGDRSVPASALFDFAEGLADLRVVRLRGPHFILQARPREALDAIQRFMGLVNAGVLPRGEGRIREAPCPA